MKKIPNMPKRPTNNTIGARIVFPMGFSIRRGAGVQLLAFTWRQPVSNQTVTEEIMVEQHDPSPLGAASLLREMAARIERRSYNL